MMEKLIATLTAVGGLTATLSGSQALAAELHVPQIISAETYAGPYEITPGESSQTAEIAGKIASENIVINPIPSNYGLISWDGRVITVS